MVLKTDLRDVTISGGTLRSFCKLWFLTFRVNLRTRKSIQKWRVFGWFLAQKNQTLKSDKLALIDTKILNLMFLDIYIPVVLIENWLRATHNQRQKTLKVASVLLFGHDVDFGFNSLFLPTLLESHYFQEVATFR